VRALLWGLFDRPTFAQTTTVLAGTPGEGAGLASVRLKVLAQPATVVSDTTSEGAAMASFRLVGVASASHFGGCYDS
jgi:hypothetical protein